VPVSSLLLPTKMQNKPQTGDAVVVRGLQQRPELNGRFGQVTSAAANINER
jgi:hypothetical protein